MHFDIFNGYFLFGPRYLWIIVLIRRLSRCLCWDNEYLMWLLNKYMLFRLIVKTHLLIWVFCMALMASRMAWSLAMRMFGIPRSLSSI